MSNSHNISYQLTRYVRSISIFVSEKGSVYSCGWGADGQTGLSHYNNTGSVGQCKGDIEGSTITKVSCSADCVLALDGVSVSTFIAAT